MSSDGNPSEKQRKKEQRRIVRRITVTLLVILFFGVVIVGSYLWITLDKAPLYHPDGEMVMEIEVGEGAARVGDKLYKAGLVRNALYFRIRHQALERLGRISAIQIGRFTIPPGARTSRILEILTSPENRMLIKITVKEGWTIGGIGDALESEGITTREDFVDAAKSPGEEWRKSFPLPKSAISLEGYLFPDTYFLESPLNPDDPAETAAKAREVAGMMVERFFEVLDEIDPTWEDLTATQLHDKVILASIVEREYRVEEEASKISKVFLNRIEHERDGTKRELQSCATVVYIIMETPEGEIYREEYLESRRVLDRYLEIPSPYNTYLKRNYGLPPGPISNPGRVALNAAFFPYDGPGSADMLFFVLKPDGSFRHEFRATLEDHNAAKRRYLATFGN